ncbi:MAG: FadR family transcriptional regulator [Gracilibacteraceae bacterium]|jgi:GntR family transcriptional repressor for pyruvate dehydrogenase complex|nr:FadR family transcriptional regulator [Gracilibacteraceae bacterium]
MKILPVKTRRIYQEVVDQIKLLIAEGQIKAGDRLPSERDLAERLQISRASVREALSALEVMGLLEVRSGEGAYVKEANMDAVVSSLAWMLYLEKDLVLELLEVRKILETQAAALAAQRRDEEDLQRMQDILAMMRVGLSKGELGDAQDYQFHYALARAAKNKILLRLMNAIADTMQQTLTASRIKLYEEKGVPERLYEEHAGIFRLIEAGEEQEAREYMLRHLEAVEQRYTL